MLNKISNKLTKQKRYFKHYVASFLPIFLISNSSPYEKGKFSVQDVQFRRALLSDFEAIMAFGDLYEGGDYLWALYEEFVSDPENYCIVAVLNDVVVS